MPNMRTEEHRGVPLLPTFEEIRARGYALLGGVQAELRSDWRAGTGPTEEQHEALREARRAVAAARDALSRAAG